MRQNHLQKTDTDRAITLTLDAVTAMRDLLAISNGVEALVLIPLIRQSCESLNVLRALKSALNEPA